MITLPQGDLPKASGILRTAAQHNAAHVGVFASVVNGGTTRRGDQGSLTPLRFMSSAGVPAEPWEAVEFHAVNGEIVSESGEADEHKAYAMEAARRSDELTRSLNSEEFSRRRRRTRSSLDLDCSQSLRASPQWRAATTVADVSIP